MFPHVLNQWGHNEGIQSIQLSQINSIILVVQQTHNVFCAKILKTGKEAHWMIKTAFWKEARSHTQFFEWFFSFKHGNISTECLECSGYTLFSRNDGNSAWFGDSKLKANHQAVHEEPKISFGSSQAILTKHLGMRPVSAKFVFWHKNTHGETSDNHTI